MSGRPESFASSEFDQLSEIGRGAYGTVYKARHRISGQLVAMKQIPLPLSGEGVPMNAIREIAALRRMECFEHRNIVRFLDVNLRVLEGETRMTLVFEYIDQDLASYLEQNPSQSLGQEKIRDLMAQLLSGIEFLHCHKVVHRDLKPQNILVTRNGLLKIADFGLARLYAFQMTLTAVVVTLWYRAPEVILQAQYATPVDMWSCGCIFAELFNRRPLFRGQSEIDQLVKIFDVLGLPPREEWPDNAFLPRNSFQSLLHRPLEEYVQGICPLAKDLLLGLLTIDPRQRLSAKKALEFPYFHQNLTASNGRTTRPTSCANSYHSSLSPHATNSLHPNNQLSPLPVPTTPTAPPPTPVTPLPTLTPVTATTIVTTAMGKTQTTPTTPVASTPTLHWAGI